MEYKVGDKVLVRNDLECEKRYGGCKFAMGMIQNMGTVITIKDISNNCDNRFHINEGFGCYVWTKEMFVGKLIGNRLVTE